MHNALFSLKILILIGRMNASPTSYGQSHTPWIHKFTGGCDRPCYFLLFLSGLPWRRHRETRSMVESGKITANQGVKFYCKPGPDL
jgi:hypothetical protein